MIYVIVGGPHDGRRVYFHEPHQTMYLACFADITTIYEFSEVTNTSSSLAVNEMYKLTELRTQLFRYTFYRYHKLTVDQAIGALINGYHNNPTE